MRSRRFFQLVMIGMVLAIPLSVIILAIPIATPPVHDKEIDEIYMLTAYSLVLEQWQDGKTGFTRGFNIGSILVKDGKIVGYGLNSIFQHHEALYHGEMTAMLHYLRDNKPKDPNFQALNLAGITIYSTLEPCLMCYGTARMLDADRIVYGATAPDSGANSTIPASFRSMYPYDTKLAMDVAPTPFVERFDKLFGKKGQAIALTNWLSGVDARNIFHDAYCRLQSYQVKDALHEKTLRDARAFLKSVKNSRAVEACTS